MKRILAWILTGVMMAGLLVGCGQASSQKRKTNTTAEDAVKQEEQEALQLSELAQDTYSLMCVTNDSIFAAGCYKDNGDWFSCIMQYNRQGEEQRRYSLGEAQVEGISGELICYSEEKDNRNREVLYMAPIETGNKEETVILKKKKKIAEVEFESIYDVYVWKSHVYYVSDGDGVYHYNGETEETKCLVKFKKDDGAVFTNMYGGKAREYADTDQKVYLTFNKNTYYSIDREEGTMEHMPALDKILDGDSWGFFAAKGDLVFMLQNKLGYSRYICYDREAKKVRSSFQKEDLEKFLQQQGFEKREWRAYVMSAYSYGDRLYLYMILSREEKVAAETDLQKGKKDKQKEVLLSCPWEDIQDLRYEKEISQWFQDHQEYEQIRIYCDSSEGSDRQPHYTYIGRVDQWAFYGDEILVSYQDQWTKEKNGTRRVEHYKLKGMNLKTGEVRDIPEKDTIYQIFKLDQKDWRAGTEES